MHGMEGEGQSSSVYESTYTCITLCQIVLWQSEALMASSNQADLHSYYLFITGLAHIISSWIPGWRRTSDQVSSRI